jgi:hypothetical protein
MLNKTIMTLEECLKAESKDEVETESDCSALLCCPFCGCVVEPDTKNDEYIYHPLYNEPCILEDKLFPLDRWRIRAT